MLSFIFVFALYVVKFTQLHFVRFQTSTERVSSILLLTFDIEKCLPLKRVLREDYHRFLFITMSHILEFSLEIKVR